MNSLSPCLLLTLLAGCGEPSTGEAPRERFEIVTDFDGPICAGNIRHLEERLAWLEETLDLTVDETIEYHWLEGEHELCIGHAGGCAEGNKMWGPWRSADHELVHVVMSSLGRPKTFISEGLAVALSEEYILLQAPEPPSQFIECTPQCYEAAGHFVRYLLEEHGIERFKQLYERSDYFDDAAELFADFEAVYDQSFAEFEELYLADAFDLYPGLDDCRGPAIALDGAAYSGDFEVACDDPEVLRVDAANMLREVRFALSTPTNGAFLVDGSAQYSGFCPPAPHDVSTTAPPKKFAAGTHTLYLASPIDAPVTRHVEFVPE